MESVIMSHLLLVANYSLFAALPAVASSTKGAPERPPKEFIVARETFFDVGPPFSVG